MRVKLGDVCERGSSNLKQSDIINKIGEYPIYGAAGYLGQVDFYHQEKRYVAVVKDGAGIGRTTLHPAKSSVIGTMQYLLPKENVLPEYLYYVVRYMHLEKYFTGATIPHIYFKDYKNEEFNLDTLERQTEIVSVLKKVENIIGFRQHELQKLDNLIKARFVELFGDPVDNPMGWTTKQLQELVTDDCTISYGIVQTGDDQDDGVPVFRPVDIVNRVPVRSELKKTTQEISNKYKRTILKGREMLITVRANIADTFVVGEEFAGCNVGRGIVPIRTKENEMILEFLKYQIDSKHLNDNIKALAKGITLIQLNMEDLREVTLIVPPIEKQKSFVEFAKQVDKSKFLRSIYCDRLHIFMEQIKTILTPIGNYCFCRN